MGRHSTGVTTVNNANCIDIDDLRSSNLFVKDKCIIGSMSWQNGNVIGIETFLFEKDSYLKLHYSINSVQYSYKIEVVSVPSNLGVGRILYFLCPISGKRCRKLYRAYGFDRWKCREAYKNRLYYDSQLSEKNYYYNDRYWFYERVKVPKLLKKCKNSKYNGKPTKALEKYYDALDEMRIFDLKRWWSAGGIVEKINPNFSIN